MKQTITKKSETEIVINFSADPQEWEQALDKAYDSKRNNYTVQGFRKGKAPRKMVEQNYGDSVFFDDAIVALAQQVYSDVLNKDNTLDPIGEPDLKIVKFDSNGIEANITLNIIPPVKLGKYKGLKLEANFVEFKDEMVDDEIKHAQQHYTETKTVEGKVAEMGDTVTIDFVGSVDGVEFDGGKATDYDLVLGSKSFVDTFEQQLVGTKAGEHKTVNVQFPADYGAKTLAGKKAVFECDVKAVKVAEIPEINDEFAKKVGDFKNVDEFKKEVAEQIKHRISHENEHIVQDTILASIVKDSTIIVPDILIEQQLDVLMRDMQQRLAYQGIQLEDYANYVGTTVEALREERKEDAKSIARTKLVFEAIIKAENIKVEEKELNARFEEIAKIQGKTTEQVKKDLNQHRIEHIYSDILMNKLTKFLADNNTVTAKSGTDDTKSKKQTTKTNKTEEKTAPKKTCARKTTKKE